MSRCLCAMYTANLLGWMVCMRWDSMFSLSSFSFWTFQSFVCCLLSAAFFWLAFCFGIIVAQILDRFNGKKPSLVAYALFVVKSFFKSSIEMYNVLVERQRYQSDYASKKKKKNKWKVFKMPIQPINIYINDAIMSLTKTISRWAFVKLTMST